MATTTAYIKEMVNATTSDIVYPVTKSQAVYMEDNSTTVQKAIDDLSALKNVPALGSQTSPNVSDLLTIFRNTNSTGYKALVSDVAKTIIESYQSSSLAGKNQSVKAALDSLNSRMPSYIGNFAYLGGISGAELDGSNFTPLVLNDSVENYRLIRLNTSYYKAGLPDYGGVTVSTTELKRATAEPIFAVDTHDTNGSVYQIKFVDATTLSVKSNNSSASTRCLSVHGILD